MHVHTFVNNIYSEMTNFPGSEVGRTVCFFILGPEVQYDVSQDRYIEGTKAINITTHTSSAAKGSKVCTVNNIIISRVMDDFSKYNGTF